MAKRKNAIALFEVITAARRKELEAEQRQSLGTSRWWFKRRGRGDSSQEIDPTSAAYVSGAPSSAFSAPADPVAGAEHDPTMTSPAPMVAQRAVTPADASPSETIPVAGPASQPVQVAVNASPGSTAAVPRRRWFGLGIKKVGLDPDRQEVTVRFRYTTAILAGFAVLVALGLAFVMGRRSGPAVADAHSPSTEEIQAGRVLVNVLNPDDGQIATLDIPAEAPRAPRKAAPRPAAVQKDQAPPDRWAAPGIEARLPRVIGLNYVIIQSYHDRKDADAARDALVAAGIPCTVERTPRTWSANPNLFSVIGTHGFARPKTMPQFDRYTKAIMEVNATFAGKSKYLRFDPSAYQWKQEDEDARRKAKR